MSDMILQNMIISYPNLFEPKQYKGTGKPRYGANFIFPANYDFTAIMAAIDAAKAEMQLGANSRIPLSQVEDGPYAGHWQISAYAYNYAPQVVDQALNPIMDRSAIFAGCKVNVNLDIYPYNNAGHGVSAGLKHIQIVDNSDAMVRLDSRRDASEVFQPVQGAPAPTAQPNGNPNMGMPAGSPQMGQPNVGVQSPSPMQTQNNPMTPPTGQVPMGAPQTMPNTGMAQSSPMQSQTAPQGYVNPNDPSSYLG